MRLLLFYKSENISQIAQESWIDTAVHRAFQRHACGIVSTENIKILADQGLHPPNPASHLSDLGCSQQLSFVLWPQPQKQGWHRIRRSAARLKEKDNSDPFPPATWLLGRTAKPGGQGYLPLCAEEVVRAHSSVHQCPLMDTVRAPGSRSLQSEPPTQHRYHLSI